MPVTKKLVPFDYDRARQGAVVKTAKGQAVNILRFDNPGEYPICGTYEDGRGKLFYFEWYNDGEPSDLLCGDVLKLEVDEVDFFPKAQARKDAVTAHVLRTQIAELDRKVAELKAENTDLAFSNGHLEGALTTMTQDRDSLKAQIEADAEAVRLFHCIKSWIQVTPSSK